MAERATIAIVDPGGRGSALVEAYARSPHVKRILAIPGNDLMHLNSEKPVETFPTIKMTDADSIVSLARERNVMLVDVAQDDAIAADVAGRLREAGIDALGASRAAGKIEWSKSYARRLGTELGIRQPGYQVYQTLEEIEADEIEDGYAKADGLAGGKGARRFKTRAEKAIIARELKKEFPIAAETLLIEDLLTGEELSVFYFVGGKIARRVGAAQDNKRALNFDEGENTGGMGGHTSPLIATPRVLEQTDRNAEKLANAHDERETPYNGIIYEGCMVDLDEIVNLVEWNSRWGDPEAQLLLPGFEFDMYEAAMAVIHGGLENFNLQTDGKTRVVFAAASRGYPGDVTAVKGKRVWGIEEAMRVDGVRVYGAGIKRIDGVDYANGGRLLYIVGEGKDVVEAREKGFAGLSHLSVEDNNLHTRTDIAWRDIQRLRQQEQ